MKLQINKNSDFIFVDDLIKANFKKEDIYRFIKQNNYGRIEHSLSLKITPILAPAFPLNALFVSINSSILIK